MDDKIAIQAAWKKYEKKLFLKYEFELLMYVCLKLLIIYLQLCVRTRSAIKHGVVFDCRHRTMVNLLLVLMLLIALATAGPLFGGFRPYGGGWWGGGRGCYGCFPYSDDFFD